MSGGGEEAGRGFPQARPILSIPPSWGQSGGKRGSLSESPEPKSSPGEEAIGACPHGSTRKEQLWSAEALVRGLPPGIGAPEDGAFFMAKAGPARGLDRQAETSK